ncbi:MAG: hypothetical protein IPG82_21340 [Saprospiraceae bacterium]|nr:hypothetical protein [Saprospiraceae bacterium]
MEPPGLDETKKSGEEVDGLGGFIGIGVHGLFFEPLFNQVEPPGPDETKKSGEEVDGLGGFIGIGVHGLFFEPLFKWHKKKAVPPDTTFRFLLTLGSINMLQR